MWEEMFLEIKNLKKSFWNTGEPDRSIKGH